MCFGMKMFFSKNKEGVAKARGMGMVLGYSEKAKEETWPRDRRVLSPSFLVPSIGVPLSRWLPPEFPETSIRSWYSTCGLRRAATAAPGGLLEMQELRPQPSLTESESADNKFSGDSRVHGIWRSPSITGVEHMVSIPTPFLPQASRFSHLPLASALLG